ncbi:MAG: type I glyceraldehyde-3-phosphate dehydrogenase, partial [Holophagales bacterium]|nr:type I glyceraldehyde-3-phosphate dehydrogenase [Holophagales bacterium]
TGPEKVLISAIADDADLVVCRGINEGSYDRDRHHVVSNASCTTNCLAVVIEVLRRDYGIRQAFINEVHSYTANQRLVDSYHPDPRRSRAAAANIVPTGTAAPAAVERLIPELRGRLDGLAVRVPTPNVALLDVVANLERPASAEQLNTSFEAWSAGRLAGLLDTVTEPWVSSDFVGCPASAVVDLDLTRRVGEDLHRVVAWYDNEWGYAHRLADILEIMGSGHGAEPNRPEHGLEPTGESP